MAANQLNPLDEKDRQRLATAIEQCRLKLKDYRENNRNFIRQYVGGYYGSDRQASGLQAGSMRNTNHTESLPFNLVEMYVNIYVRQLAARTPAVLVTTPHIQLKPYASTLELGLTHLIGPKRIGLGEVIQEVVINAIFGLGILKHGLMHGGDIEDGPDSYPIGEPFADSVNLDAWVHDMGATNWDEVQFMGNKYHIPYELFEGSGLFESKVVEQISPSDDTDINREGEEELRTLGTGTSAEDLRYRRTVELWDIWMPQDNLLVTIPVDKPTSIVRIVEWDGPEHGPYQLLKFNTVPGNTMPLAPIANMMDLHVLANNVFRKLARQAHRQKTFTTVQSGNVQDGKAVRDVNDGEVAVIDQGGSVGEMRTGGIDQLSLAFFLQIKDLFNYRGGNLDAIGGLSAQADTLGQEKLIAESASKSLADMQDRTVEFTRQVVGDLAFYLWYDPLIELPLTKRVTGTDIEVPITFSPEQREGKFLDYNFDIETYSMQHDSPGQRLQTITQVFRNFIAPYMPMLEQQGITVNFEALLKTIGKYSNMPELEEFLTFFEGHAQEKEGIVDDSPDNTKNPQSTNTTRTYERVNRPGATGEGKDQVLMQALLGQQVQPAQQGMLSRQLG